MGNRREFAGVEEHYGKIRISFQYQGARCRETLDLAWSVPNARAASKLRDEIRQRIKIGAFRYHEYFPDSPNATRFGHLRKGAPTFGELAKQWLDGHDHIAPSTKLGYRKILNAYWMPSLWDRPIDQITSGELKTITASHEWKSNKTRNNAVGPLRQVFAQALDDGFIDANPAEKVKMAKVQTPDPDPLTLEEVEVILAYMRKTFPEPILNYFEFAFFTGLRTSEIIALPWDMIDFRSETLLVRWSRAGNATRKLTKTGEKRDIEMNSRAMAAIKRQKAHTFLAGKEVFINPNTGESFISDKRPREWWDRALRACGLRHRVAYQTRHTFATLNLMAGANPMWVARQMGHSTMKMTLDKYGRWIPDADKGRERGKLELQLSGQISGQSLGIRGE